MGTPLVAFAPSASDARGRNRGPQPLLLDTRHHDDEAAAEGRRAAACGLGQGIDPATRRCQPTGFGYVAKRSAENGAHAGAATPCAHKGRVAPNVT